MRLFGGGDEFLTNIDLQNTSAGTNLLVGSKDWATNTAIYGSAHALDEKYLNGKIMALTGTGQQNSLQIQNLSVGTQIAWSVWAKSTGTAILHTEVYGGAGSKDIQLGSDWTRISSCGVPRGSGVLFFWNNTPNSEIDLCLPKIELGSIATQWCPAPEDYVMKSDPNLKNAYPNVNCDTVGSDFDLNMPFVGWRKNMDNLGVPKNAPSGVLGTTFYLQMRVNPYDPNTCIEVAVGLGNQPEGGGNKAHPHIWVRQNGWQTWTEWFKVC